MINPEQWLDILTSSLTNFWNTLGNFIPNLIGAIVLLFIWWIVAKTIAKIVKKLLDLAKLEEAVNKTSMWVQIKSIWFGSISVVLSKIVYWVIYLAFINTAFGLLWLEAITDLINQLVAYMPLLLVALIIIIIWTFIADFIKKLVLWITTASWSNMWVLPSTIAYRAVMFIVFTTALNQAKVDISFLTNNITLILWWVILALSLAFWIWWKDTAKEYLDKMLKK